MGKYRITSIPQSLPKNQLGGLFKKRKKKDNSIINYTPPSEETMVQGLEPQSNYYNTGSADDFSYPYDETFPQYNVDNANYFGRARTPEEEANTFAQPFNWNYGTTIPASDYTYRTAKFPIRNPIAERNYEFSLEKKLGIPYSGFAREEKTVNIPESFVPDYFAPYTETGQPLTCGEGKRPYKGQCLTEEAIIILMQRDNELEQFNYQKEQEAKQQKFQTEISDIRRQTQEQADRFYARDVDEYYEKFKSSKKPDKIEPFKSVWSGDLNYMVPVLDENGQPVIDEKTGQPLQQSAEEELKKTFLLNKTENGYVELYPLGIVRDRIIKNGFQAEQFKNYWGLDPDQVKNQVGELMQAAKTSYDQTVYNKILNRSLERAISPDEAAGTFSTKLGYPSALKKEYAPLVKETLDKAYQDFADESMKALKKDILDKKPEKQKINFDFGDESNLYKDTYDDSGVLIKREFNLMGNYAEQWINAGKTAEERFKRRKQVNAIYAKKYNKQGNEAYQKSLNDPMGGYMGDPFEGMSPSEITRIYGDRMQNEVSANYRRLNDQALARAGFAKTEAEKAAQNEELAKLTGFNEDFQKYMTDQNKYSVYNIYKNALTDSNITDADKARVLQTLRTHNGDVALGQLLYRAKDPNNYFGDNSGFGSGSYMSDLNNLFTMDEYGRMWEQRQREGTLKSFENKPEIGVGTKTWDVLTNPGDSFYYWMNPREEMWGEHDTQSYNERKEKERVFQNLGVDLGTYKDVNPMFILDMINSINPLHWGDELTRGYQAAGMSGLLNRSSDLGWEALANWATRIPAGQTFRLAKQAYLLKKAGDNLSRAQKAAKVFNTIERGINSAGLPGKYLVNYGRMAVPMFAYDAVRPYGTLHQGFSDIGEGNYLEGAEKIGWGALAILPYGIKGFNALRTGELTPGLRAIYPEGISYATNAEQFRQATGLQTPGSLFTRANPKPGMIPDKGVKYYRSLAKQTHPDIVGSNEASQLLQDLYLGKGYQYIPFNANMQTGIISPKYQFGRWSAGPNVFQPKTLEELLQIQGLQNSNMPINRGLQLRQKGGSTGNPIVDSLRQLGNQKQYGEPSQGLSTELSDSEIDMYVKGGYIIEDQ